MMFYCKQKNNLNFRIRVTAAGSSAEFSAREYSRVNREFDKSSLFERERQRKSVWELAHYSDGIVDEAEPVITRSL